MTSTKPFPLLSRWFAIAALATSAADGEATVGAYWDYQTIANNYDQGAINTGVFSDNNFSQIRGSFAKSTSDASIAVSASEGRVRLLNRFSIGNGTFGRFGLSQLVNVTVGGGFADRLTINAPGRAGQPGFYTGSIRVDLTYEGIAETGSRNVFGVGVGDALSSARTASQNIFLDNGGRSTYAYLGFTASSPQSYSNRIVTFTVPITFGEEFGMAVWMESFVGTEGRTSIATSKSHDASNTVTWAGTVLVEDAARASLPTSSYNLVSVSSRNYQTAITGTATYSAWVAGLNLSESDAAPSEDPNHNGLSNLIEYAFGSASPETEGSAMPVAGSVTIDGQKYLTLTYSRPAGLEGRTDLIYTPERATSFNPPNWSAAAADVTHSIAPATGGRETVTVRSTHPSSTVNGTEFLRMKLILRGP